MTEPFDDRGWSRDPADYWADPGYLRELEIRRAAEGPHDKVSPTEATDLADDEDQSQAAAAPLNLPSEFWEARQVLRQIREAAHHYGRPADVVLAATLTRISAMVDPGLRFDTGLGPGSLNFFTAAVGPSGVGKTTSVHTAQDLLVPYGDLARPDVFRDGLPLGTGEGLAEAFMGVRIRDTGEVVRGKAKTKPVRQQVRKNVFVYLDEGEQLTKTADRRGATIGSAIRSAWVGATLGQANASDDTSRVLQRGGYSLGLLVGFQRATALPLLNDAGPGTPQRFFWVNVVDPSFPDDPPPRPAPLFVQLVDALGEPLQGVMEADPAIRAELWRRNVARIRGDVVDEDLDSHEALMRSKLAALLALLDDRHDKISLDDWVLAEIMWRTSCAVRDSLIRHARLEAEKTSQARERSNLDRKVREVAELDQVPAKIDRIARLVASKVVEAGGLTSGHARRLLSSRDRHLFEAGVERAAGQGWVVRGSSGLVPGEVAP